MRYCFNPKIIVLQYRLFSCGKFLSNILSYNKNFIPQYGLSGKHDLPNETFYDIDLKHDTIMNTFPPDGELKKWQDYELGCDKFYGFEVLRGNVPLTMTELKRRDAIYNKTKDLLYEGNVYCFAMAHTDMHYNAWKGIFPLSKHIQLVNDEEINSLSKIIKTNKAPIEAGKFTLKNDSIKFDIGTLLVRERFFAEVTKLLTTLGLDDVSLDDRVNIYYDKYLSLYKPYLRDDATSNRT